MMKNILLLTDFSNAADAALEFVIPFSNKLITDITLFHVYQVYSTTGSFLSVETFVKEDIEKDLGKALKKIRLRSIPGIRSIAKHLRGEVIPTLAKVTERKEYDLVVMGNHGAGERTSIFWGSTTSGLIQKTHAPILTVPESYTFKGIKNIVLAADDDGFKASEIRPLIDIARAFNATVWIYHADETTEANLNLELNGALKEIEHSFHFEKEENVEEGIQRFVAEKEADLLCMIKRKKGFWERFFRKSITISGLANTTIPVLVLQEE